MRMRFASGRRGMTLVEGILAIVMISVVFLSIISLYTQLGKGTIKSKTRSIATNLSQEKIEALKDIPYYRVVVSTDTNPNSPGYGSPNIPEIGVSVGGFTFDRYVEVDKVQAVGSTLTVVSPYTADTGLKAMYVTVRWMEGESTKSFTMRSTMEDPNRVPLGGTLEGTVTASGGGAISGAKITSLLNLNWTTQTDASGAYSLLVGTGVMRFQASAKNYFNMWSSTLTFSPGATLNWSPALNPIQTGTVTGYAIIVATVASKDFRSQYGNPPSGDPALAGPVLVPSTGYLKISQVIAGGSPVMLSYTTHEFVELYNPTSYQISFPTSSLLLSFIWDTAAGSSVVMGRGGYAGLGWLAPTVAVATVPSGGFLLIASTGYLPEATLAADCSYYGVNMPEDKAMGVAIGYRDPGGFDVSIDSVGWCKDHGGFGHTLPMATGYESGDNLGAGTGAHFPLYGVSNGLAAGERLMRKARATSTISSMSVIAPGLLDDTTGGNGYDTEISSNDFVWLAATTPWTVGGRPMVHNLQSLPTEYVTASSATVTVSDGLSSAVFADKYGYFRVVGVATAPSNGQVSNGATGDWTVEASTTLLMGTTYPVYVRTGLNTSATVYLTGSPATATIVGGVKNGDTGAALSGIKVTADNNTSVTDANGRFVLPVTGGTAQLVVANPNNADFNWTEASTSTPILPAAGVYNVPGTPLGVAPDGEMWLYPQAAVSGRVTTGAANDPVPYVVIQASSSNGLWNQSALTSTTGFYLIKNLRLTSGYPPYLVTPLLDQNDTSTPASRSVNPAVGTTTTGQDFSIAYGWATLRGSLNDSNGKIQTGVLLVATTDATPMSGSSPDPVNAAFRSGSDIYYGTVSLSDGTYALQVRYKPTSPYYVYTVYAWYARLSGDTLGNYRAQKSVTVNSTSITVDVNSGDWSSY